MSTVSRLATERRNAARMAMMALGRDRRDRARLHVRCARSHHLAVVYDTEAGLVYVALTGPHAHGSRDFVDVAHHAQRRGREYVDLLAAADGADDALPAWCECGPRNLSRTELAAAVHAAQRQLQVT